MELQQAGGVEVGGLPADCNMKMRARGAASTAAEADFLTSLDGVSLLYFDF